MKCHYRTDASQQAALSIELCQGHGLQPLLPRPSRRCAQGYSKAIGRATASSGVYFGGRAADSGIPAAIWGERFQVAPGGSEADDAAPISFIQQASKPATTRVLISRICIASFSPENIRWWRCSSQSPVPIASPTTIFLFGNSSTTRYDASTSVASAFTIATEWQS